MDKYPKYISKEQQERFEQFLLGQMQAVEENAFTKKLAEDEQLKRQFEEFKALFFAVEEEGLRMQLDTFHEGIREKHSAKKSSFTNYQIAASIAILISLGLWFFIRPSEHESLFNDYFSPDPGLPTVMGTNDNYDFYEAMVDYKQGNYTIAIKKWKTQLQDKPSNDTLNYFLGVAHLNNGKGESAISFLRKVTHSKSFFAEDAKHYLGLAYLKIGEIEKAKRYLEKDKELLKRIK